MKFNLDSLVEEYRKLEEELSNPEIFSDQKKVREVSSKKKSLEKPVEIYIEYKSVYESIDEAKKILEEENDAEMIELAKMEKKEAEDKIPELEEKLQIALIPKDPNDDKNVMVEVRAWTWWDEAALFAWELSRAYIIFAEEKWFKTEIVEKTDAEVWWVKEVIIKMSWDWAYSIFKFEWWVHRVQRIPSTESKWRVHTSAVTVAIMPEVDEIDIDINPDDVEMTFTRSSWAGWQHVNKTDSAVQLKHKPSGIMVFCQDWRSQHQNREKAWEVLRSRLYAYEEEKRAKELGEERLSQVGSWDRSEKIRTYNFPQDRITDHRIGQNFSWIPQVMTWRIAPIVEALQVADEAEKLKKASES